MKEYKILQFKKGDFQDQHGNFWCDMSLEGISEPVRIVVKDPTKYSDGMEIYGEIKEQTSKAGKPYNRFFRSQKPEADGSTKSSYQPRDDAAIRAQWSIGQSMSHFGQKDRVRLSDVEELAKALYAMVDRVKASDVEDTRQSDLVQAFSDGTPVPDEVHEVPEDPIDLSQIPF